jgi:hypothetical protein
MPLHSCDNGIEHKGLWGTNFVFGSSRIGAAYPPEKAVESSEGCRPRPWTFVHLFECAVVTCGQLCKSQKKVARVRKNSQESEKESDKESEKESDKESDKRVRQFLQESEKESDKFYLTVSSEPIPIGGAGANTARRAAREISNFQTKGVHESDVILLFRCHSNFVCVPRVCMYTVFCYQVSRS